jgi:hypothetical protein
MVRARLDSRGTQASQQVSDSLRGLTVGRPTGIRSVWVRCFVTATLAVLSLADCSGSGGWINGPAIRSTLSPLGYSFKYNGSFWVGGRSDVPGPSDPISIDDDSAGGPAYVSVYVSRSAPESYTSLLEVGHSLGVPDATLTAAASYDREPPSPACSERSFDVPAGEMWVVRTGSQYFGPDSVDFKPAGYPFRKVSCPPASASPSA